jgi:DNA-directed RNA polymerase specialized sigma24 family protein
MVEDNRGSVTLLIAELQAGDDSVAQREIWERYFRRIITLARMKLGDSPRASEDEEDVALSALGSFFRGLSDQRFPQLKDRDNLWCLLVTITVRKAINQRKRQMAAKRGGAEVKLPIDACDSDLLQQLIDSEISPDDLVAIQEECQRLMEVLGDDKLRQIARWKLEGWTNAEAATELGIGKRTIERKLELIRSIWSQEGAN